MSEQQTSRCPKCKQANVLIKIETYDDDDHDNFCEHCEEAFSDDEINHTVTIPVKEYEKLQKIQSDFNYWKKRIRAEFHLVEGQEFSRLIGIYEESQLWLKNKDEFEKLRKMMGNKYDTNI